MIQVNGTHESKEDDPQMDGPAHRVTRPRRIWRGFVALALLALSVLLVRPVCDAYTLPSAASDSGSTAAVKYDPGEPDHHSGELARCCASIDETELAVAAPAATGRPGAVPVLVIGAILSAAWPFAGDRRVLAYPRQARSRTLSYYARSARILL